MAYILIRDFDDIRVAEDLFDELEEASEGYVQIIRISDLTIYNPNTENWESIASKIAHA